MRARRYTAFSAAAVILAVGLNAKPATSFMGWAKEEAERKLAEKEAA